MTEFSTAGVRLVLEGALTIRTADTVCTTLRQAIGSPSGDATAGGSVAGILIDCADATEIDLAFIQLLIAARVSADRKKIALSLASAPNGALLETLTRGGFQAVSDHHAGEASAFWFDRAKA